MHAADVLQASHYLMQNPNICDKFSPMDRLILYISAAIHDFDHPGVNNNFMINTQSSQAILYNDKSVLENHHIAASFLVYDVDGNDFLRHVSRDEYKVFRSSVIDCVLATDLSLHFSFVSLFKTKVGISTSQTTAIDNLSRSRTRPPSCLSKSLMTRSCCSRSS